MRSLVMMNRIIVINRPAISGFNFSCLQAPHFDQVAIAGKEGNDKAWDRNRYRYRRYQAHFAYERYQTVCIRVFQDADGFCYIKNLWGVSSVGRASVLQAEGRRFEACTLHLCRLNESGESASLTRKKLGVRFSQSVLDHQYNGQNTSLRTKRQGFNSLMVYLAIDYIIDGLFNNNIEREKTGTSLAHLWVSYNGQYICLPNKWCEFDSRYPLTIKYASIAQLVEQLYSSGVMICNCIITRNEVLKYSVNQNQDSVKNLTGFWRKSGNAGG